MKKNRTVWSSRFTKGNSKNFQRIGSSINIDKRLYKEDIFASIIHSKMLIRQKIIPKKDGIKIINGLKKIEREINKKECHAWDKKKTNKQTVDQFSFSKAQSSVNTLKS